MDLPLHVLDGLAGVTLIPAPVEILGDGAELDNQVGRKVLRLDFAALLPPQPQQGGLVVAHDDPGVRAADEGCGCALNFVHTSDFMPSTPGSKVAFPTQPNNRPEETSLILSKIA